MAALTTGPPSLNPAALSTDEWAAAAQVDVGPIADGVHFPPVEAPVIDPFRAPEHEFGPGNRGIEFDTTVGQQVSASAAGVVSFAGQVGGNLFVTVDHGNGLVTTVGFLEETLVETGTAVEQGSVIGTAGQTLHFSARLNNDYIDPQLLFDTFAVVVRLVAGR